MTTPRGWMRSKIPQHIRYCSDSKPNCPWRWVIRHYSGDTPGNGIVVCWYIPRLFVHQDLMDDGCKECDVSYYEDEE
jgi:hypothetical protein